MYAASLPRQHRSLSALSAKGGSVASPRAAYAPRLPLRLPARRNRPSSGGSTSSSARCGSSSRCSSSSSTRAASARSRSFIGATARARRCSSCSRIPTSHGWGRGSAHRARGRLRRCLVLAFVHPGNAEALATIFAFYLLFRGVFDILVAHHRDERPLWWLTLVPRRRADPPRFLGRRRLRSQGVPARRVGRRERARARRAADLARVRAPAVAAFIRSG